MILEPVHIFAGNPYLGRRRGGGGRRRRRRRRRHHHHHYSISKIHDTICRYASTVLNFVQHRHDQQFFYSAVCCRTISRLVFLAVGVSLETILFLRDNHHRSTI